MSSVGETNFFSGLRKSQNSSKSLDNCKASPVSGSDSGCQSRYIPPYRLLKAAIQIRQTADGPTVEMPLGVFSKFLALALEFVNFDEKAYVRKYGDVADAIAAGQVTSGFSHFASSGYFEDRDGGLAADCDQGWYMKQYPDVAQAIREKQIPDALTHWKKNGYFEGRAPDAATSEQINSWRSLIRS